MYSNKEYSLANEINDKRNSGDLQEAIELCIEASNRFPESSFFPKLAGDMYRQIGQFNKAADQYLHMLRLIQIEQFPVFVKAYRNMEKSTSDEFLGEYKKKIQSMLLSGDLSKGMGQKLNLLLGEMFPQDSDFLAVCELATNNRNRTVVKGKIEEWGKNGLTENLKALARFEIDRAVSRQTYDKQIALLLIQHLERFNQYDLALELIENTQKVEESQVPYPYTKLVVAAVLRICRKMSDDSFVEKSFQIDNEFIALSDFNIQYELVYYFQRRNDDEGLNRTLNCMRGSASGSIPIAKTLYNFYLSLNRLDDAEKMYHRIRRLEQNRIQRRESTRQKGRKNHTLSLWEKPDQQETQMESEQAVWQRMKELSDEQEHNRQMIALRDLLKGFSHELGQPITNIRYAVQLHQRKMRRKLDTPDDIDILFEDILAQTNRLGMLLKRFSPIVSPKDENGNFSVCGCAKKVCSDLETRLHNHGIVWTIHGSEEIRLPGDEGQFSQVFYNLVLNSIQAIEDGGRICIDVAEHRHNTIQVVFCDDGPGIPEKYYHKIFEPFFSTKDPTSGNGGEGLGLYIVWNVLKMFNGSIQVDRTFLRGTKFIITIKHEDGGYRDEQNP